MCPRGRPRGQGRPRELHLSKIPSSIKQVKSLTTFKLLLPDFSVKND